jgi:ubiquitin carboxyl-terminal hydrolase 7
LILADKTKSTKSARSPNSQTTTALNGSASRPSDWIEDAQQFYDYLLYRKLVHFLPHPRASGSIKYEPLDIEMSSKFTYDQIAAKVGEKLGVNPTHLRFHTVNSSTGNPKTAVKRNLSQNLQTILTPPYSTFGNNNQRADELFFEVLDMSLSELDTKKNIKVTWLSEGITKDVSFGQVFPCNLTNFTIRNHTTYWSPEMVTYRM